MPVSLFYTAERATSFFFLLFLSVACMSLSTVQYITLIQFKPKFAQLDATHENTRNYTLPMEWGSVIPLGIQSPILDVGRWWHEFFSCICTSRSVGNLLAAYSFGGGNALRLPSTVFPFNPF